MPVAGARADQLRGFAAQILVDAALHDPVDELLGRAVLGVPAQAALEPAVGALGRALGVGAVDVEGRALVEHQRDVRAQGGLRRHRVLRGEEAHAAVDIGAKAHAGLVDLEDRPLALAGHGRGRGP